MKIDELKTLEDFTLEIIENEDENIISTEEESLILKRKIANNLTEISITLEKLNNNFITFWIIFCVFIVILVVVLK